MPKEIAESDETAVPSLVRSGSLQQVDVDATVHAIPEGWCVLEISMKSTPMRTKKAASNLKVADRTMVASHRWLQRTVSLQLLKSVLCLAATATGLS